MKTFSKGKNLKGLFFFSLILLISASFLLFSSATQDSPALKKWEEVEFGCTSIQVAKLASTDGSVITCHTCDGNYRMWVNMVPPQEYPEGAKNKVYTGKMHTETSWDLRGITEKGEIPQVEKTYAFLNTAYPCFNEHQLAIGETTIGGKRELRNGEGMFMIEELERIALERCTNARDAIRLIGELVKEYGYGDWGECITIADPKEVWHFEIFGEGLLQKGAIWAAVRIPDDHIGISANIPRIAELDLDDPDHYMASHNVFTYAEKKGWWDPNGDEPFKFWKAYSGRKPFSSREYFVLNTFAPSLNLDYEAEELPFSVKPDKKVSVRDIIEMYRQTYAGTEWDSTQNLMVKARRSNKTIKSPIVSPWMSGDMRSLLNTLKPDVAPYYRTIAIAGCSYSHITQCRDWLPDPVGGVSWFSFDNPGQSARFPIFAGVTELLPSFEVGAQHRFRRDSAAWAFRRANKLATFKWGQAKEHIEKAIKEFEEKAFVDLPDIEKKVLELYNGGKTEEDILKAKQYLTKYTNDFARAAINKYWELGDKFWTFLARGY
ncbi:MAG: C69 family dipeptidase [Candidatus Aminicenantes bacterium]|nr:MAG: C69 family dipeptidase [Candidatus Aminicenantes bacterium]